MIASALLAVALADPPGLFAAPQDMGQMAEARRLLIEASHLVKDIPEFQRPSAAANIAGQLMRAADLPDALATAQLLGKAEDQAQATGSVAWQLAHDGNVTQALALVDGTVEGQNKAVEYEILAEVVAEKGNLEGALQIAHLIRNDPDRLCDTLVRLASRRAHAGDLSGAREALGDALNVAEDAVKQSVGHASEFTGIATTEAEIGDTADAYVTLDRFSEIARQYYKGAAGNAALLQQLASAQAQIGDVFGAQRTIEENSSGNFDLALMSISQEQAKQGLTADALESAARISSPAFKASAFREVAMIQGMQGALDDALEAIDRIAGPGGRAEALATLALEQADNKNPVANLTLQMAWQRATQMGPDGSDDVLGTIAVTRARLGDFNGAQEIVQNMADLESRVWPLWNITSFMVQSGHTQEALALTENQEAAYPKAYALLGTAEGILDRLESKEKALTEK